MSLSDLSNIRGISGQEKEVRSYILKEIEGHCDEIWVDNIGNLYARRNVRSGAHIGLFAHMDEVGMMVTGIDDHLLHFDVVGGINSGVLTGTPVKVGPHEVNGVIGCPPAHMQKKEDREKQVPLEDLRIDIGAPDDEIAIGDMVTFDTAYREMRGVAMGKAFDDRIGCQCLINAIKRKPDVNCTFVFTTQEEAGLRGAKVAADKLDIDVAIACEGTFALDHPRVPNYDRMPRMGHGPVITIADKSVISDRRLMGAIIDTAEGMRVPHQFKRPMLGGTDVGMVHLSGQGVPSCVISNPCRYIHSPCSVASVRDIVNTSKLITSSLVKISEVM